MRQNTEAVLQSAAQAVDSGRATDAQLREAEAATREADAQLYSRHTRETVNQSGGWGN